MLSPGQLILMVTGYVFVKCLEVEYVCLFFIFSRDLSFRATECGVVGFK